MGNSSIVFLFIFYYLFINFFGGVVFVFVFLGPRLWHMEVPRLGVESELQLLAYSTATATPDLRRVCVLYTPQLTATPDPQPTEQGQGLNPHPHGCQSGSLTTEP